MLRGEAWDLFRSIAQRSEIAASALSRRVMYDDVSSSLGQELRVQVPYVVSMLHRMDRSIRGFESSATKAQLPIEQIKKFVELVKKAHENVGRFRKEAAPALEKLQLPGLAPEQEDDVQSVLNGKFDSGLERFKGPTLFSPLENNLKTLQWQVSLLEPSGSDSVGGTGEKGFHG